MCICVNVSIFIFRYHMRQYESNILYFSPCSLRLPPLSGGLMIPWRRRWCVLKDETFMWFRAKQDSVKSGWLYKKGGGMSTLSRRNWKMRWFVLRESKLMYFENDSEEKLKGTIDIRTAK